MKKVRLSIHTPFVGGDIQEIVSLKTMGFSDEEWDSLTVHEKDEYLDEWAQYFLVEKINYNAEIIED